MPSLPSKPFGGARRDLAPRLLVKESNASHSFSDSFVTAPRENERNQENQINSGTTTGVEDFERDIWPQTVDGNAFENQLIVLNFLPTGCEGIDDVLAGGTSETGESLGGGLRQGQVTEITGECGSGKTQLCLSAAASAAAAFFCAIAEVDDSSATSGLMPFAEETSDWLALPEEHHASARRVSAL